MSTCTCVCVGVFGVGIMVLPSLRRKPYYALYQVYIICIVVGTEYNIGVGIIHNTHKI